MSVPPLRAIRSASVLMPTWQGIEFLERVLDALAGQRTGLAWDLHVVDSGSTDGTWEHLCARRESFPVPLHLHAIEPAEFDHGDTRNLLAARSAGDLLVFLTQDAIPSTADWLSTLARNFESPAVGAAYCRNVPRPDARLLTRVFCRSDPGYGSARVEARLESRAAWAAMSADERRLLCNFNDVASAVRRELWERHPFPRTMMGEDVLIARGILLSGYTVVYDAEATVDHSHDYGPDKMRWRGQVDGRFNAEWMGRVCIAAPGDVAVLTERLLADDARVLAELGTPADEIAVLLEEARPLRRELVLGLHEGGLSTRRYPTTRMRERGRVDVLYVAWGASRGRAIGLAEAIARRGHRATVLALGDAAGAGDGFRMRREDRAGLLVLHASGPADPSVLEAAFQSLVLCERPEVVHFLDLGTPTGALVRAARELGLATVAELDLEPAPSGSIARSAAALADLRLCRDAEGRRAWLAGGELDPQTLAYSAATTRGPRGVAPKTSSEEAAELEFRYRALACIDRSEDGDGMLLDAPGASARATGETLPQGPDWLLLRPGSSAAFALPGLPAGRTTLELEQFVLASEPEVVLAGRARVDGVELGRFEPLSGSDRDRAVRQSLELDLPEGARELRLEPHTDARGGRAHLRVCRVRLARARPAASPATARRTRPPADLAALAEELRVTPGPPVDRHRLPRVAVVVPNLDGAAVLPDCLASLAALDYEPSRLEVLLVDNGSTDGSLELVRRRFPSVRVLAQGRNLGFAAACNAGARAARGAEVIAFLNNDMRFEPSFLRELVAPLVRRECAAATAKILGWEGRTIDTSGTGTTILGIAVQPGYGRPPRPEHDVPRRTLFGCGGAMAIDAGVLADVGGFDEEYFAYYEDLDLGWRMWVLGHEIHYVPSALCHHHHSHTSRRFPPEVVRLVMIRNSLFSCVKNYDDLNLARILPALLALAIRRAHLKSGLDPAPLRIERARLLDAGTAPRAAEGGGSPLAIERTGAADLLAIDDLLANWEHWMRRRREIQSRRRRGDDEIQRMFLEPLACVEGDEAYATLQRGLFAMYGLDDAFGRS